MVAPEAEEPLAKRQRANDGAAMEKGAIADEKVAAAGNSTASPSHAGSLTVASREATMAKPPSGDAAVVAREVLMPPVPGVPPVAPKEERRQHKAEKQKWWTAKLGIEKPDLVYCSKDYALWPEEARELFRATKINTNDQHASKYMRQWFKEHEGMPGRVPKIVPSAYMLYSSEQQTVIFNATGKFDRKKDGKKVGAAWKQLDEEGRQPYDDKLAALRAERDANEEWRSERMTEWEEEKQKKLADL